MIPQENSIINLVELRESAYPSLNQSIDSRNKLIKNSSPSSSIVTLNISGLRFQTYSSTLDTFPDTLLGDENQRKNFWNEEQQEYFFDRDRACFEVILQYYQSKGYIRRPETIPLDKFLDEIHFFQLGPDAYNLVKDAEDMKEPTILQLPKHHWRKIIWCHLRQPGYSKFAKTLNIISIILTLISGITLALFTLPGIEDSWKFACLKQANISLNATQIPVCPAIFQSPIFIIQTICVGYFTIEFIFCLISAPSYLRFFFNMFTWVDILAIVPYYIDLASTLHNRTISKYRSYSTTTTILLILRLPQILKLFTIFKHWTSLRALTQVLRKCIMDFIGIVCGLIVFAFLFGSVAYFAEKEGGSTVFDSLFKATYWGIITMTTVGYGDVYPVTGVGRILSCLCALFGVTILGMMVTMLVDNYRNEFKEIESIPDKQASLAKLKKMIEEWEQAKLNRGIQASSYNRTKHQQSPEIKSSFISREISQIKTSLQSSSSCEINFSLIIKNKMVNERSHREILEDFENNLIEWETSISKDIDVSIAKINVNYSP